MKRRRDESGSRERSRPAASPHRPLIPVALSHPGFLIAALVTVAALVASVTFRIFDFDLWQHLAVGRYIWTEHRIPTTQLWTWPTYGRHALIPAWGFRILLWPFWAWGGATGLFVWRWITTLLAFGFVFAAARRMGADPIATLVIIVLCALPYRMRTMARPETLAFVLFAIQVWLLESRRHGGPRRSAWLVIVAWIWINVHISFYIGFIMLAFHALGALSSSRVRPRGKQADAAVTRSPFADLLRVFLISIAVSFLNPFGWEAVLQPLRYLIEGRSEAIYKTIGELSGIEWSTNWKNGLPLLMAGWPALIIWRAIRRRFDRVEALTCVFFTAQALVSQRFAAFYSIAAAPYVGRDVTELVSGWRRSPLAWPVLARGALASIAIVALGWTEWSSRPRFSFGLGLDLGDYPVKACDFIERTGIRGRAFNHFWYGGYLEYRFWPDRGRMPFIDGHTESGTRHDRTLYTYAHVDRDAWLELDRERQFDWLLLSLKLPTGFRLRDFIETQGVWSPVFIDDAAVVFVRRGGSLEPVAERYGYRLLRVGPTGLRSLMVRCSADTSLRDSVAGEFRRQVAESPNSASAHSMLAEIALMDGRRAEAHAHLDSALVADPLFGTAHERIGRLDLADGRVDDAEREFRLEYRLHSWPTGRDLLEGMVRHARGDVPGARAAYERELRRDPTSQEASDSLAALSR
jgi:hypothetical protein